MTLLRAGVAAALLGLLGGPVWGEMPTSADRPMPRPVVVATPEAVAAPTATVQQDGALRRLASARPMARPVLIAVATVQPDASIRRLSAARPLPRPVVIAVATAQPDASIRRLSAARPLPRPAGLATPVEIAVSAAAPEPDQAKAPKGRAKKLAASRKGSVCGDPAIKGEELARITSKVKGCGVAEPVRITSVSGVGLNQAATMDCDTARALKKWVDTGLQPAFGRTQVVQLKVAAHYICRSRNNIKGGKISEHGKGKAVDIAGVVLDNGKTIMVQGGFGPELRRAHKAACGIFGTTLGPGSDGFHEDHLHFDTATNRGRPYCR